MRISVGLILLTVAMTTAELRADLQRVSLSPIDNPRTSYVHHGASELLEDATCASTAFATLDTPGDASHGGGDADRSDNVVQLPAAPSSTALFLSAMVSLGAWQLVRSGRDMHLGALPEWYHSGGPRQIGHVTALNLDFSDVPVCNFEKPFIPQTTVVRRLSELALLWQPQSHLLPAESRGPPLSVL